MLCPPRNSRFVPMAEVQCGKRHHLAPRALTYLAIVHRAFMVG
jgi:hypothetical protein